MLVIEEEAWDGGEDEEEILKCPEVQPGAWFWRNGMELWMWIYGHTEKGI